MSDNTDLGKLLTRVNSANDGRHLKFEVVATLDGESLMGPNAAYSSAHAVFAFRAADPPPALHELLVEAHGTVTALALGLIASDNLPDGLRCKVRCGNGGW